MQSGRSLSAPAPNALPDNVRTPTSERAVSGTRRRHPSGKGIQRYSWHAGLDLESVRAQDRHQWHHAVLELARHIPPRSAPPA